MHSVVKQILDKRDILDHIIHILAWEVINKIIYSGTLQQAIGNNDFIVFGKKEMFFGRARRE